MCRTCSAELLAAKTVGIQRVMKMLVGYAGADILPQFAPVTFHVDGDEVCGQAGPATTGFAAIDQNTGKGHVCLFDVEKETAGKRWIAFTPTNAESVRDQLLAVHEAGHIFFFGREHSYLVQEAFVYTISFVITDPTQNPNPCFKNPDYPWKITSDLCELGMKPTDIPEILRLLAKKVDAKKAPLSEQEFANVVSEIIGRDATPAFRQAGLIK